MKNLETEYRKAFTEEMPDLWGRIESNLPPKNISAKKLGVPIITEENFKNFLTN